MGRQTNDLLDLLTDRERDVLALLRQGLTNSEIAHELLISADGAKYHVSEILRKLGVHNRYEAAHWPERPPWWMAILAPILGPSRRLTSVAQEHRTAAITLASALLTAVAVLLGLFLFLLIRSRDSGPEPSDPTVAYCPSRPEPGNAERDDLTVDQVVNRYQEAINCPGYVTLFRSVGDSDAGPYSTHSETMIWLDARGNRSRVERTTTFTDAGVKETAQAAGEDIPELKGAEIFVGGRVYSREYDRDEQMQFNEAEASADLSERGILVEFGADCGTPEPGAPDQRSCSIEQRVTYRGRPAIALVRSGKSRGSDETSNTTTRLFVDRETFLPLGQTSEGTLDIGDIYPVSSDIPYDQQFIPVESLPDDLFDPASIGFILDDFEQRIPDAAGPTSVYWLGTNVEGGEGLPPLRLDGVYAFGEAKPALDDGTLPQPVVRLNYRTPDDDATLPAVILRLYPKSIWDTYLAEHQERGTELVLDEGRAVIIRSGSASSPSGQVYYANVYIGDTVVRVAVPLNFDDAGNASDSPYNSEAAIEYIVRSLSELR